MRFIWIILCVFCLSSCSIIDACFNSHLATQGRKYNSYGKSKSGTKSYAAKRPKRASKGKMAFASDKKSKKDSKDASLSSLGAVATTRRTQRVVYTKEDLKRIKKENKKNHKKAKKGKGKFRYSYDIPSPYDP